jgi:hypothetical protein
MLKVVVAALLVFSSLSIAHAEEYKVSGWPQAINELPCSAFRKNADGGWTLTATIKFGGVTMSDDTFKGGSEARMIEAKCGSK